MDRLACNKPQWEPTESSLRHLAPDLMGGVYRSHGER